MRKKLSERFSDILAKMHRKRLLLSIVLAVISSLLILYIFGVTGTGIRIKFRTIGKGISSGHTTSEYYVIQNNDEWTRVWNQHTKIMYPRDPLPQIDFSKTTVIGVFMGQQLTTGYGIEVKEIIDTGLLIVVKVEKTYPKGCAVGEMLTNPYHIVSVDKIGKYIIFDTSTRARECS
jgi:hypothetical protein